MSLLTTYSLRAMHTKVGLCVRYRDEKVDGGRLYTRYATKAYSFVGMTYKAAKTCAAEKISQYRRIHRKQEIKETTTTSGTTYAVDDKFVIDCLCSISVTHGEGDSWDVEISVNETETRASLTAVSDLDSLFSVENKWSYDEYVDGGVSTKITLDSVSANGGVGSASASFSTEKTEAFDVYPVLAVTVVDGSKHYGTTTYVRETTTSETPGLTFSANFTIDALPPATCTACLIFGTYVTNSVTFVPS